MHPTTWTIRHTLAFVTVAIVGVAALWFVATKVGQTPAQPSALAAPPATTPVVTTTAAPTTTTTTVPPTAVPPVTVPPVTYPSATLPPLPVAPPPTLPVITVPSYVPGPVVQLAMQFAAFLTPTTSAPVTILPLPKARAKLTVFSLASDSGGCNGGVCIDLYSQGGRGPVITDWQGTSASAGPCSQIQLRLNNVLVAETARTCDGPGDYSASWMPDLTFAPSGACVDDVYRSGYPCEAIQLSPLF